MRTWNQVRAALQSWWPARSGGETDRSSLSDHHLLRANQNLKELLEDTSIPSPVRQALEPEFREVEMLAEKLRREEIHIAVFGRVGTGKSSLCNALLGRHEFSTSPLHGETKRSGESNWREAGSGHVILLDTPGIDELDGSGREKLAREVAGRADILLFVCEADLTDTEFEALNWLAGRNRPLLLVLNKSDRYSEKERTLLLEGLVERCRDLLDEEQILSTSADPRPETLIRELPDGNEQEESRERAPDVKQLKETLWRILENEGKTIAALNAALFASELDSRVADQVVRARAEVADKIIRNYCLAKGLAVAANPVPVADLLAAAGIDVAMVVHLGQVYGHPMSRREASKLLLTIAAQLVALMGAYWGVNLASSALKGVSAGMSTVLTGTAQGALAWYATYVIGTAAQSWFARGKTWGPDGPRETVRSILSSLDRDSILSSARDEIVAMVNRPSRIDEPRNQ